MSWKAIAWAQELKLRGSQKPVLRALADYADEDGSCYPGQDLLAHDTGFSIRTVRRCIERLEEQGLIVREARHGQRGWRTSDRYYLQLDVTVLPDPEEAPGVDADPDDPEPDAPLTAGAGVGPVQMSAEPVDNPPTGQSDRRSICPSLPANLSIPTGHGDRAEEIHQGIPQENLQGGASAKPTCGEHPNGTRRPCPACGDARRRYDAAVRAANAPPPPRSSWRPGLCRPHLQAADDCEACAADARHDALIGVPA